MDSLNRFRLFSGVTHTGHYGITRDVRAEQRLEEFFRK